MSEKLAFFRTEIAIISRVNRITTENSVNHIFWKLYIKSI